VKPLLRLALLALLATTLSGCGRSFLIGKWTLDRETTIANLTAGQDQPAGNPGEGFLKELVTGLQKGVSRLLLTQFEGVEVEFTATEMRRMRNGTGEAVTYEVIEKPGAGTVVLKYADGEIVTWGRADSGIRMRLPGEEEHWIYFKVVK
jgi:hypothetical protein